MEIGFLLPLRKTDKLSAQEKLLWIEIYSRLDYNGLCATQNEDFAKWFRNDERSIQRWISNLKKKGFLKIWYERGTNIRFLEPVFPKDTTNLKEELDERIVKFNKEFPERSLNNISVLPKNFLMDKVIERIKESEFLSTHKNIGLRSCIKHYEEIINGIYASFDKDRNIKPNFSTGRNYTKEEMNALFQDIEDIEI